MSSRGLVVLGWGRMMIARNNFHLEINTIHIENMINQLDQGKTARGKIAADNVIIQPQPKTDTERGVNPAHLIVELKKLLNILYQIPTILLQTPKPILSRLHDSVESSVTNGLHTGEPGTQERGETRNFFEHIYFKHGTEIAGDMNTQVMTFRLDKDTGNTEDL